ncbi:MAG: GntR family transcriptional regulator [Halanaerobiales bacterium]
MKLNFEEDRPIFQQIADMIEDNILNRTYKEEEQITSTTEFSRMFQINPATANKGINILIDEGILYKKRGIGTFVASGARGRILRKRRDNFYQDFVLELLEEADKLSLSAEDIVKMIKEETK